MIHSRSTTKAGTLVFLVTTLLLLPELGQCFYNPSTGRWLSRDPIEEDGGENVYAIVSNAGPNRQDFLGECGCTCLDIQISPDPKDFKKVVTIYPVPELDLFNGGIVVRQRFGVLIHWNFIVDGVGCKFHLHEGKNGVSGTGPDGKIPGSDEKDVDVPISGDDPSGIKLGLRGDYTVKYNLKQTWTCTSTDGKTKKKNFHWKGKASQTW